jgi:hypothetical protein
LQEEVERSLKNSPPANRQRYLQALLHRFPVAGQVAAVTPVAAPAAPPPAPAPLTPDCFPCKAVVSASRGYSVRRRGAGWATGRRPPGFWRLPARSSSRLHCAAQKRGAVWLSQRVCAVSGPLSLASSRHT